MRQNLFCIHNQRRALHLFYICYIENGELKGLTFCDTRDFVMPWTGKRKEEITK
ncbi:MAG: hypothetical protein R2825_06325 [Saprospiraceae bacterium]